jgi:hypothetical protein
MWNDLRPAAARQATGIQARGILHTNEIAEYQIIHAKTRRRASAAVPLQQNEAKVNKDMANGMVNWTGVCVF